MAFTIARLILASLFILGGIAKIISPEIYMLMMAEAGIPQPRIVLWLVIGVELIGGLLVAFGPAVRADGLTALAASLLMLHTAAVNVVMHNFWDFEGARRLLETGLFFKNVAIIGGLLLVYLLARQTNAALQEIVAENTEQPEVPAPTD